MTLESAIANAIKSMALVESEESRLSLKNEARSYNITSWKDLTIAKVSSVGVLTGLAGGPVGLALEVGDIAYLLAASGRGCYGVGHILGCEIDYDSDINGILAIWSGVAEASNGVALGKVRFKISTKIGAKASGKILGKLVAKIVLKSGTKASQKILAKVIAKLLAKLTTKISTKWIPIIGGITSGGINFWVASGLMDAAQKYYDNEYLVFDESLMK